MQDTVNAFIETFTIEGAAEGPLAGLTFGAKDLYDVAGHVTGCGNPDWARTHGIATSHAPAVSALLDAGATLLGKTHTDEIAYSLLGMNAHYGTPLNTRAPDRVPGGSSSGSAAAVAAGLIDVGLGSDTGGSVRLPASFCGIYGIRPTHGRIDISGAMALAPSFDTVGWFARDPETMCNAALAYGIETPDLGAIDLLIATDAFAFAEENTRAALASTTEALKGVASGVQTISLADGAFDAWHDVFRVCQAAEIWENHGDWVTHANPDFGPGVRERFMMASRLSADEIAAKRAERQAIAERLLGLIGGNAVVVVPTSPSPAPMLTSDGPSLDAFRRSALSLLCSAGLAGLPQLNIPTGEVDGAPVGLSLIGPRGADGRLLAVARALSG